MNDFTNSKSTDGLTVKLWRGERMVLIGMDVDNPESDFVGFSIEEQTPGSNAFVSLRNRLNFSYGNQTAMEAVNGFRNFPSTEAPFQKFRWIQFPPDPIVGEYTYRVTKQHMKPDGSLVAGHIHHPRYLSRCHRLRRLSRCRFHSQLRLIAGL